jgi:hypothetical protein
VIAREGVILAGTEDGIFRSDDEGQTWAEASDGISARHIRWMAFHPNISDFEFAGTEPANIFVSRNGGELWRSCPEVAQLRDTYQWSLPYSPEAGCVRGFAFYGTRAYAAVEVGGVLVSDDKGETWQLAEGSQMFILSRFTHRHRISCTRRRVVDFIVRRMEAKRGGSSTIAIAVPFGWIQVILSISFWVPRIMSILMAVLKSRMMEALAGRWLRTDSKSRGDAAWSNDSFQATRNCSPFYRTGNFSVPFSLRWSGALSCLRLVM